MLLSFEFNNRTYQALYPDLLRPLSFEERRDLEYSIKARGVQSPVLVDENDGIIDGIHRCITASACNLTEIPVRVVSGLSDDDKRLLAVEVNDCRRQQSAHELGARRAQRVAIVAAIVAEPELSDRGVAEKVEEATGRKPDHKTVGSVRTQLGNMEEIPQLKRTVGKDGKYRPAKRGADKVAAPAKPTPEPKQPAAPPKPKPPKFDADECRRRLDKARSLTVYLSPSFQHLLNGLTTFEATVKSLESLKAEYDSISNHIENVIIWCKEAKEKQ